MLAYGGGDYLAREMNVWVRLAGTVVCCVTLVAVAVRAAGAISGERERQTFDGLLASPLSAGEILFAKWLGSILSVRLAWVWLLAIWGAGVATGGLQPLAVPFLVGLWCVYAAFLAVMGLWYSLICRTTTRAVMATLGTALAVSFGHWLPWMLCMFGPRGGPGVEDIIWVQVGATPPAALGVFAFTAADFDHGEHFAKALFFLMFGVGAWGIGTLMFWGALDRRFCAVTHRNAFLMPEQPHVRLRPRSAPPGEPEPTPTVTPLRGATLIEDTAERVQSPTRLRGARLVEEIWEEPPRPPAPPAHG